MSRVFFSVAISLDGFIAGLNGSGKNPLGDGGLQLHQWAFRQKDFPGQLGLGKDGETGADNDMIKEVFNRIGSNIMGKHMFNEGEPNWPEDGPFHTAVYVLTHEQREPWERKGGQTFYFINDGIQSALEKAKRSAGGKDVRISGGAIALQQYLNAGLVDEFYLHQVPIVLRKGVRLFENIDKTKATFEQTRAVNVSKDVTHLHYKITNKV